MPAPAVYVIAVLGTVAAGFAFKEYVYDPHIKPKVRQWQIEFAAGREARRRRRMPVAVSVPVNHNTDTDDSDEESDSGKSRGYEMETLNPTQVRTRTRTLSREGIESWRTGIQSTISATTLRKRNTASTSTMPADSRSLISPSSSTLVDRSRQTRESTPLIPIQTGAELGNEMNTHILTDVDTETISDSTSPSTSSIRQLPSEASIISTFDFNAPETPASSSTIMISTDNTGTSFEQLDNLARMSSPVGPATAVDPPSDPNNNPFLDPNSSPLTTVHASSPLNHSTYPTYPTYPTTQPDMWSSNPSITESIVIFFQRRD
ncbi:transmembrane protein [Lentinula edodes]|uniref:Transmembrane protein n=1 Tax=Lentinula edodes TaxID=5353 RepID=A0A1Q3ERT1_LENED|nr:transmembrane protein [Lentinula edodes]